MKNLYTLAITNVIQNLSEEIGGLKSGSMVEPEWSIPALITEMSKGIKGIGVYRIIYKPTLITMSVGQGNISARKGRHKAVFLNKGKDIVSKSGATSPSVTGQKMYQYDTNINNWLFSFCVVGNKKVAVQYEKLLQEIEEPEFNILSMGGIN
jgi:hypothetical protein|tara:strand:- start:77 stop:532 length:456 start_codon:yes stop_codon:yes gene_type:complete